MSKSRCQKCKKFKPAKSFSGNQLKKPKTHRRCKVCSQNGANRHVNKHANFRKPIRNFVIKCENVTNCSAISAIIDVLKLYETRQTNLKKVSQYFHIHKNEIMNSYYHILQKHLNQEMFTIAECNNNFQIISTLINDKHGIKCNLEQCKVFNRSNRERERGNIFDFSIDFVDSIHCVLLHSIDTGFIIPDDIINMNDESKRESTENNNRYYDEKLANLTQYLRQKRKISETNVRVQHSKFSTNFQTNLEYNEEKSTENNTDINYSFGKSFNYWNIKHHSTLYDYHGCKPKYISLKDELTCNKTFTIDIKVFDQAYKKAENLMGVNEIKCLKCQFAKEKLNYGIELGRRISLNHVLSVVFYTDYTTLSCKFSATFREKSANESDEVIKKRNREFGHWAKYLIETVNCFGTKVNESKINSFYHGVSLIYFDKFVETFNCPTSTTTKLQIATIFAKNNGIILELTQNQIQYDLRYFNCSFISFYSNEDEKLFIQPPDSWESSMKIINIRQMSTMENYASFFHVMDVLHQLLGIRESSDAVSEMCCNVSQECIDEINGFMNFNVNFDDNNLNYPPYICKTLQKWMDVVLTITVSKPVLQKYAKGCMESIWHDSMDDLLKCDQLNAKFKGVELIQWQPVGVVDESFWKELLKMVQQINKFENSKLKMIALFKVTINLSSDSWELCRILFKKNGWIAERKVNNMQKMELWFTEENYDKELNSKN